MTLGEKIERLRNLSERFSGLMSDPHPGLSTWMQAVGRVLDEIAAYAPSVPDKGGADPASSG